MNPNGQRQFWSEWKFYVWEVGRYVPRRDVEYNAARWVRQLFGQAGEIRVDGTARGWRITAIVEGPPAHDPRLVEHIRQKFQRTFIDKGWGPLAGGTVTVRVLAGNMQDGKPQQQWVGMPPIGID